MKKKFMHLIVFGCFVAGAVFLIRKNSFDNSLHVSVESKEDFSQIVFTDKKGNISQLTEGYSNHFQPHGVEDYVVWIEENFDTGAQQIMRYQISTKEKKIINPESVIQNQHPQVNSVGQVVWQGWVEGIWQVFLFDTQETIQITSGDMAITPRFHKTEIEFLRRNKDGEWRSETYSLKNKKTSVKKTGEKAKEEF